MIRFFPFAVLMIYGSSLSFGQDAKTDPQQENSVRFEGKEAGDRRELVPRIFFRWCPPGTFTMGVSPSDSRFLDDELHVHVSLTNGFWLGETEVTQGQWQRLMGTSPWKGKEYVKDGDEYPATYISHHDTVECVKKLTIQERATGKLPNGWKYSLPTEAQWEYACRAGTTTRYSFGSSESDLGMYGWFHKNAYEVREKYAHRVGLKNANAWGFKDMHGNVHECCVDFKATGLQGGKNPEGPSTGFYRVNRGGCWLSDANECRSAQRNGFPPGDRGGTLGFRLAVVRE